MKKIDISTWQPFRIDSLFNVVKGTRLTKANMKEGNINFIGASAMNNGITTTIGNTEHLHSGNTITVSYNGSVGESFYQTEQFWASDDVNVLYPKFELNENIALFFIPIIKRVGKQYAFVNKWKKEDMEKDSILLPSINGRPDFAYIEKYMKDVFEKAKKILNKQLKINQEKKVLPSNNWRDFQVGELLKKVELKVKKENFDKKIDVSDVKTEEFNLPLVNAKHFNNGIMYYGRKSDFEYEKMTIDIVQNGAIATGDVYVQPQDTGVLWDAYLLKPLFEVNNEHILRFIATSLRKTLKDKYGYDDKCTWEKVKLEFIKLPSDSAGNPDFAYMENYMKNIMAKQQANLDVLQKL